MHINRCTSSIDQSSLSRYKELQKIEAAKKGLLNDYSHKMISSISCLQDKSSEVVVSNIQINSRGLYSSNTNAIYDTPSFRTSCSKSSESNPKNPQKGSIFSWETITHRRWWLLMRHNLQLQSLILLFLKVYLTIYLRKIGSRSFLR